MSQKRQHTYNSIGTPLNSAPFFLVVYDSAPFFFNDSAPFFSCVFCQNYYFLSPNPPSTCSPGIFSYIWNWPCRALYTWRKEPDCFACQALPHPGFGYFSSLISQSASLPSLNPIIILLLSVFQTPFYCSCCSLCPGWPVHALGSNYSS